METNIYPIFDRLIQRSDRENNVPEVTQDVEAVICWFSDQPLHLNGK